MKRPRSHEISSISEGYLQNTFAKWVLNPLYKDYALDYMVTIVENRIVSNFDFYIQLKSTDSIKIIENFIDFDIKTKFLKFYNQKPIPVLIILYDTNSERGYWLNIQKYIREILDVKKPKWKTQKYIRLKIPKTNTLNDLTSVKEEIVSYFHESITYFSKKLPKYSKQKIVQEPLKHKVPLIKTHNRCYLPIIVNSKEINIKIPILFQIDTGADTTVISASDLPSQFIEAINFSKMESLKYVGIGGVLEIYTFKDVDLYFLNDLDEWFLGKKLAHIGIIPIKYNSDFTIHLPSLLGQDIIGNYCSLSLGIKEQYLEFDI